MELSTNQKWLSGTLGMTLLLTGKESGREEKKSAFKDIPVIMVTTEGAEEDRKRAIAIGANAYLPKPIQTQELLKLVTSFLSGQRK
jgi:DNA-binding response OmpR family regulator